jgi:hypothetical protein
MGVIHDEFATGRPHVVAVYCYCTRMRQELEDLVRTRSDGRCFAERCELSRGYRQRVRVAFGVEKSAILVPLAENLSSDERIYSAIRPVGRIGTQVGAGLPECVAQHLDAQLLRDLAEDAEGADALEERLHRGAWWAKRGRQRVVVRAQLETPQERDESVVRRSTTAIITPIS